MLLCRCRPLRFPGWVGAFHVVVDWRYRNPPGVTRRKFILPIVTTLSVLAALPAHAAGSNNGGQLNGIDPNGIQVNGFNFNGGSINGQSLQGRDAGAVLATSLSQVLVLLPQH